MDNPFLAQAVGLEKEEVWGRYLVEKSWKVICLAEERWRETAKTSSALLRWSG